MGIKNLLDSRFFDKDRGTQERWFRMKFHALYGKELKGVFLKRLHVKLEKEFSHIERFLDEAVETTFKTYNKIDGDVLPASKHFFNLCLFFILAARDVQSVKADAFASPSRNKRSMALRTLLLTVYEWDMGKVAGKDMKYVYEVAGLSGETKSLLVDGLKRFRQARKNIIKEIAPVRHNAIAHRDADAKLLYEIISSVKVMDFELPLVEFYTVVRELTEVLTAAMLEMGALDNMLKQALESGRVE